MQDTTWLTIDEAARRSGRNPGGLRRRAATELLGKGMARLVSGGGKRPYYEIREDADPDFARVKTADQMGNDLRDVSESARAEAIRRRQVLHDWAKAKTAAFTLGYDADAATGRFLQQLLLDRNVNSGPYISGILVLSSPAQLRTGEQAVVSPRLAIVSPLRVQRRSQSKSRPKSLRTVGKARLPCTQ